MAGPGRGRKRGDGGPRKSVIRRKAREVRLSLGSRRSDGRRRANLVAAIAHPLRRRMLRLFHGRGKPLSSVQMARLLGLPVGTVAYHARVLWRFGALEAARERQLRGAIARFYDSTIEDDPPIEALLEETRELDDQEGGLLWDK